MRILHGCTLITCHSPGSTFTQPEHPKLLTASLQITNAPNYLTYANLTWSKIRYHIRRKCIYFGWSKAFGYQNMPVARRQACIANRASVPDIAHAKIERGSSEMVQFLTKG